MEVKKDISYGIVPVFKKDGIWQVLVIHQISYRGDDFWIFPKGHKEEGESPTEAALRELKEETAIVDMEIKNHTPLDISYSFTHEGVRIEKTVEYFIGLCKSQDTHISQPQEIKELRWCSFEEAVKLLTHQNSKKVLQEVMTLV